jgi:hypothetical protein
MKSTYHTIKKNYRDIEWWRSEALEGIKYKILNTYGRVYYRVNRREFVDIAEEDWDNLLLLDACRYDLFKEEYSGPGKVQKAYSRAPNSALFFRKNFADGVHHDIVSVTGNPFHKRVLDDSQFHSVYHLWKTHWNDKIRTVHPKDVQDVAVEAQDSHPNKRLMIHFMQPHTPFISEWGRDMIGIHSGNEQVRQLVLNDESNADSPNPYAMTKAGEITRDELIQGYKDNLRFVLRYIRELLTNLEGKTIISADHGELLGERAWPYLWRKYQHPPLLAEKLLEIPWTIIEDGERKRVQSEVGKNSRSQRTASNIEQRLRHLGYR